MQKMQVSLHFYSTQTNAWRGESQLPKFFFNRLRDMRI